MTCLNPWSRRCVAGLIVAALWWLTGCRAWVDSEPLAPENERADPARTARVHQELARGPAQAAVTRTSSGLDVQAATPSYCRTTTVTPSVADQTTEHDLHAGGWLGQLVAGSGAVALGVGGGLLLSDTCALATASQASCVEEAKEAATTLGTAAVITSGVLGVLFLANAFGTIDETDVVASDSQVSRTGWQVCRWTPLAGALVELRLPGGRVLSQASDAHGRVHFAMATSLRHPGGSLHGQQQLASLRVDGRSFGMVQVAGSGRSMHTAGPLAQSVRPVAQLD
ncbi:MAG: hypothetical protein JRI68_33160 [Deltaproteobacteria bacterium]|nr:hypothetical protein [Deltaproteobacteria bacterium]